ncbi:SAVED domain-containing protein [Pedobacter aquatilis]|uniref:SAVED domain-containing protein n=1 Tax=Pedobacter aquatilis TaxID=351343 RepID=UPI00292EEF26|nr:SAVED domain-containing protein [Pedobacter aquatilis]
MNLIIKHTVHAEITDLECLEALDGLLAADVKFIEINPARIPLGEEIEDWEQLALLQQVQLEKSLRPLLNEFADAKIYYFGFAPVPLILHLGYFIDNYRLVIPMFRHHQTKEWFMNGESERPFQLVESGVPSDENLSSNDVAINVSISVPVDQTLTDVIVGANLMKTVAYGLSAPGYDVISTQKDLAEFAKRYDEIITLLTVKYPKMGKVHVFASVPPPVAFVMGHKIQPNIYPVMQTYQYKATATLKQVPAVELNSLVQERVSFTEEQQKLAAEYRKSYDEMLQGNVRAFIRSFGGKDVSKWFEALEPTADWSSMDIPYWRPLEALFNNQLLSSDKIDIETIAVSDGFEYDRSQHQWRIDTGFFVALSNRLKTQERIKKAGRLFLFHESLHYSQHGLNSSLADGIGSFPKVIEESDYHADVYALLHEYAYAKLYESQTVADFKSWFLSTIEIMIETMWSFDADNKTLRQMQIRRVNRYLIWYWQMVRIRYASDLNSVIRILSEKPVIEIAGLHVRSSNQRTFFDLTPSYSANIELGLYINGKVRRQGPANAQRLLEGFRTLNGSEIMEVMEFVYSSLN